ncbi:Hypothetical protein MPUT9231_5090 [Mycoplasma putrefaciens Mput9231]|uniref:Uncharacterized protein n=1 Tax=Mycoplasma putrefaciens Mput9231 TaxID=1292033 RepID=M9WDT4_9MOLU|nr:Hypothetical protein MPUT9231_5090 [Mycoplasma putrefaciens Mput9231]
MFITDRLLISFCSIKHSYKWWYFYIIINLNKIVCGFDIKKSLVVGFKENVYNFLKLIACCKFKKVFVISSEFIFITYTRLGVLKVKI